MKDDAGNKIFNKMVLEHSRFGADIEKQITKRFSITQIRVHRMISDIYSYNSTIASNLKERLNE